MVSVVNGEVIGPAHFVYQCHATGPIHEGSHDPWLAAPLSPVDVAGRYQERGDRQGSGELWFGTESSHQLLDSTLPPWGNSVNDISPGGKNEPDLAELVPQLWLSLGARRNLYAAKQDKQRKPSDKTVQAGNTS